MNKGNLIDRYVIEVGRHLPEKNRADVQLELRSALQDALDERGLDAEKAADQPAITEVLKQFGKPSTVAVNYGARNFLIGPELFPAYKLVLRINLIVITVLHVGGMLINAFGASRIVGLLADVSSGYIDSLLGMFAIVTIIFYVLDSQGVGKEIKERDWNPLELPELGSDRERVNMGEMIVELFFLAALIIIVNVVPNLTGIVGPLDSDFDVIPALANEFAPFIPAFSVVWALEIALNVYVLVRARWQPVTRWLQFGLSVAGIALIAYMLTAAPFTELAIVDTIVRFSIGITLFFASIEALVQLFRLVFPQRRLPWQSKQQEVARG